MPIGRGRDATPNSRSPTTSTVTLWTAAAGQASLDCCGEAGWWGRLGSQRRHPPAGRPLDVSVIGSIAASSYAAHLAAIPAGFSDRVLEAPVGASRSVEAAADARCHPAAARS